MRTLGLTAVIGILAVAAPTPTLAQTAYGPRKRHTTRTVAPGRGGSAPRRATTAPVRVETSAAPGDPFPALESPEQPLPDLAPARAREPAVSNAGSRYDSRYDGRYEPGPGSRYEPGPDPAAQDERPRHDGVYLRADGGLGYMSVAAPIGTDARYRGVASLGAIHVGATVQDKALAGLQLWGAALLNPTFTSAGASQPSGVNLYAVGLGPELTLYLSPSNLYATAAAGVTWLTVQGADGSARSRPGLGARFAAGHEWWLGRRWGIGLSAALSFASNELELKAGGWVPFSSWALALAASVTYN